MTIYKHIFGVFGSSIRTFELIVICVVAPTLILRVRLKEKREQLHLYYNGFQRVLWFLVDVATCLNLLYTKIPRTISNIFFNIIAIIETS